MTAPTIQTNETLPVRVQFLIEKFGEEITAQKLADTILSGDALMTAECILKVAEMQGIARAQEMIAEQRVIERWLEQQRRYADLGDYSPFLAQQAAGAIPTPAQGNLAKNYIAHHWGRPLSARTVAICKRGYVRAVALQEAFRMRQAGGGSE